MPSANERPPLLPTRGIGKPAFLEGDLERQRSRRTPLDLEPDPQIAARERGAVSAGVSGERRLSTYRSRGTMAHDQTGHEHGIPAKHEGDRLEHESTLVDQRPREKKRDAATWGLWALGVVAGGAAFALGLFIYALVADRHYSVFPYLLFAAIGAGVLPGILPYLSLARSDGADAGIVRSRGRRGQADAPVEGAQAVDSERLADEAGPNQQRVRRRSS
jgi:hypothetical protein